jgi:hypothetical protein
MNPNLTPWRNGQITESRYNELQQIRQETQNLIELAKRIEQQAWLIAHHEIGEPALQQEEQELQNRILEIAAFANSKHPLKT